MPNQTARQDLDFALDNIFQHPNIAPFISKQLIKTTCYKQPKSRAITGIQIIVAAKETIEFINSMILSIGLLKKLGKGPLQARSVFNFFKPSYSPSGLLNDNGLTAPEFQIINENTMVAGTNLFHQMIEQFSDSKATAP
ncbi:hypothetical protein GQR58_026013 [Nymphon striatum]|nr:hypothetical protein GQR58_026013 [Nymphon striatum]